MTPDQSMLGPVRPCDDSFIIMLSVLTDTRHQREWLQRWRRAAVALEQVRADELAHLRAADALAATETLLALGATMPLPPGRVIWSGLIDFQRRLHRKP